MSQAGGKYLRDVSELSRVAEKRLTWRLGWGNASCRSRTSYVGAKHVIWRQNVSRIGVKRLKWGRNVSREAEASHVGGETS